MKNQLLIFALFTGLISCTSSKRSNSAATTESKPKTTSSRSSSPVFLENISINTGGKSSSDTKKNNTPVYVKGSENTGTGKSVEVSETLQFKYAILLNVPVEEVTDTKMIETIESWYGTRYRFGGNDRSGVDCSAFALNFILAMYNVSLPRTSIEQYRQSKRIDRSDLQEGDLVFFATNRGRGRGHKGAISHVGVYLRNNKFVHAATSGGVTISDLDDLYYSQHYAGAGRVR